jgi:fatty-acyl-CoA synthase
MHIQPQTDWASKWAVYNPDGIAISEYETERQLTWRQLNDSATLLAIHLTEVSGLGKGDRVAVLADNCLEYIILFCAMQKTGCVLVPLNYRLAPPEIDHLLSDSNPSLLITQDQYQHVFEGAPTSRLVAHRWAWADLEKVLVEPSDESSFRAVELEPDDAVFLLFTAGTTGFPKGAIYTHKMLFWNSINTAMSLIVNAESRTVNVMPPFHTGGWNVLTTPFLHHGGYTCLLKKFDPATVLDLLQKERVTIFMAVPTMLKMMADDPLFEQAEFPELYYLIVGGEAMPIPLIEQWQGKGVPVRQGYGMTEVGPNLTSLHQDDAIRKIGSIGRPNFYVDTRIVDESGTDLGPDVPGELLLKGPMVTPGYWKKPDATKEALENGWFHTGDMVRQDPEGYLYVVDRIKNMFISGGENVYPVEVERVILKHSDVSEVAVVGVPDAQWGEVGKAFVVAKNNMTSEDLKTHCKSLLARFKVPKIVVFVDELPKNDAGKIDRKALKSA